LALKDDDVVELVSGFIGASDHRAHQLASKAAVQLRVARSEVGDEQLIGAWLSIPFERAQPIRNGIEHMLAPDDSDGLARVAFRWVKAVPLVDQVPQDADHVVGYLTFPCEVVSVDHHLVAKGIVTYLDPCIFEGSEDVAVSLLGRTTSTGRFQSNFFESR